MTIRQLLGGVTASVVFVNFAPNTVFSCFTLS
jgi:hypothetical protein